MNKLHILGVLFCLTIVGCETAKVTERCADAQELLDRAVAYEAFAPSEVRAALAALRLGTNVCGSPQYAAFRERIVTWLKDLR